MTLPSPLMLGGVYGLSEVCLALTRRSGKQAASRDRHSLILLWLIISISIWLSIYCVIWFPQLRIPFRQGAYLFGFGLFVCGIVLRWYSIGHLGRYFTVDVAIAKEHRVIDSGPYRFIRHPSYTGALVAFLGFGL